MVALLASWSGHFGSHCNLEVWRMAAINSSRFFNFVEFLDVFLFFFLSRYFSCILFVYLNCTSLHFNKIELPIRKRVFFLGGEGGSCEFTLVSVTYQKNVQVSVH